MSLISKAIEAYVTDREESKSRISKEAEEFAERALDELQKIINVERRDIYTVEKKSCSTLFEVDSIKFRVHISKGTYCIDMITICPVCGTTLVKTITSLIDIGTQLSEEHDKQVCNWFLKGHNKKKNKKMIKWEKV